MKKGMPQNKAAPLLDSLVFSKVSHLIFLSLIWMFLFYILNNY